MHKSRLAGLIIDCETENLDAAAQFYLAVLGIAGTRVSPGRHYFDCGGTILACRLALEQGAAINLGGGFHHAASGWGGGFCVYADAPLAAKVLHEEGQVEKVLVVDLDAHQGNGTAAVFQGWLRTDS